MNYRSIKKRVRVRNSIMQRELLLTLETLRALERDMAQIRREIDYLSQLKIRTIDLAKGKAELNFPLTFSVN